jgi:capsular polysaccharide biosynthesis protein
MFSRAEAIVAPHGAGLTNLVYSPPGCLVLDVFPSHPIPYYRWLAQSCGHHYSWMAGHHHDKNVVEFRVDVDELSRRIDAMSK